MEPWYDAYIYNSNDLELWWSKIILSDTLNMILKWKMKMTLWKNGLDGNEEQYGLSKAFKNSESWSAGGSCPIILVYIISDQSTLKQCLLCWLVCQCVNTGEAHFWLFLLFLCLLLILFLAHLSLIVMILNNIYINSN